VRIERTETAEAACLALSGRLDAAWSEPVAAALEDAIRLGRPRIELDLRETTFMSSVGIGTILRAVSRFRAVGGTLVVVGASDAVREMLRVAKLDGLLGLRAAPAAARANERARTIGGGWTGSIEPTGAPDVPAPVRFVRAGTLTATPNSIAVGHVALAFDAAGAAGLFGDGLAAGGTVAVFPAEAPRPDCLASSDAGAVKVQLREALVADAAPTWHGHFEQPADGRAVTVGALAGALVRALGGPVAFVACGECAGAFGAWARTSPDQWPGPPTDMPPEAMRRALRFAGEPMHRGESMVAVAFAASADGLAALAPDVAAALPDQGDGLRMHAHVAVAGYRPMPRQSREVTAAGQLLAEQPLRVVMHALRSPDGPESAFVRGSAWAMRIGGGA
jgi:anti-anti-sigma factor